jgi:hypothetical protein
MYNVYSIRTNKKFRGELLTERLDVQHVLHISVVNVDRTKCGCWAMGLAQCEEHLQHRHCLCSTNGFDK